MTAEIEARKILLMSVGPSKIAFSSLCGIQTSFDCNIYFKKHSNKLDWSRMIAKEGPQKQDKQKLESCGCSSKMVLIKKVIRSKMSGRNTHGQSWNIHETLASFPSHGKRLQQ